MSEVSLNQNGSLSLVLTNQTDFTDSEMQEIQRLQRESSSLMIAVHSLTEREKALQTKLLSNPDYVQLLQMQEKKKLARKLKANTELYLANEVSKVFKRSNPDVDMAQLISSSLPDEPAKIATGKRGRPRKGGN